MRQLTKASLMRAAAFSLACVIAVGSAFAQTLSFPEPVSRTPVQDWLIECYQTPRSPNDCQVFQRVTMNNSAIAMVATFAYTTPTQLEIQMALPLGLDITQGARFAVGPDYAITVPISRCTQQGCLVEGTVTDELTDKFLTGTQATVTVVVPGRGDFQVPFSLNGLTEALDAIRPAPPIQREPEPEPEAITPPQTGTVNDTTLAPVTGDEN